MSKELTQSERMLQLLRKAGSEGMYNYQFPQHRLLRYSQYVSDLRDDGYTVLVERQYLPNGRATNVYRYTLVEPKSDWIKHLWGKK